MSRLGDDVVRHLQEVAGIPDLSGTKYEVIRKIAQGGMGSIFLVRDEELRREAALKVLSVPDPSGDLSARLMAEARHLARLEHPSIVPVHDVGRLPDGRVFYVMKLVRGRSLDEWMREGVPRPSLLRLFSRVCEAVAFAHSQGILHRDLKPENIMVGPYGEALVMDWGVAKVIEQGSLPDPGAAEGMPTEALAAAGSRPAGVTAQGTVLGTPAYMAPEQARGEVARLGPRTDVYALGAILYTILSGSPPFVGGAGREILARVASSSPAPLRQVDPGIPRPLASICARAMQREPEARYESARQLADDVDRFLDGLPVSAHREGWLEAAGRLLDRYRVFIWLIAGYLVLRVVIFALAGR